MRRHDHPAPVVSPSGAATLNGIPVPDFAKDTMLVIPETFETFGCRVPTTSPPTPDLVTPDVTLEREFYGSLDVVMPDGRKVRIWGFEDPTSPVRQPFPSALMRVRQDQIVHTSLKVGKNAHTIHHHGIEPTPFNDGVGHTSFQVDPRYIYQWKAGLAGTFFYHCHVNTVLHFEMGMYGLLIIDPPSGPGTAFEGGPSYDVEAFWVADDIDPVWHELSHGVGLCGGDFGLNRFVPKYFLISGVPAPRTETDPRVAIKAKVGQSILIRYLNASYSVIKLVIDGLDAEVIAEDGRPLDTRYSHPYTLPAGQPIEATTAQRYDLIVKPQRPGVYAARIEYRDWITGVLRSTARTSITVT